jgi:hypothetical protein
MNEPNWAKALESLDWHVERRRRIRKRLERIREELAKIEKQVKQIKG